MGNNQLYEENANKFGYQPDFMHLSENVASDGTLSFCYHVVLILWEIKV